MIIIIKLNLNLNKILSENITQTISVILRLKKSLFIKKTSLNSSNHEKRSFILSGKKKSKSLMSNAF